MPSSSHFNSDKGFAILLQILIMAMIALILIGAMTMRAQSLDMMAKASVDRETRRHARTELITILSNPSLCELILTVNSAYNQFQIGSLDSFGKFPIGNKTMVAPANTEILNIVSDGPTRKKADFVVHLSSTNTVKVSASFVQTAGHVMNCASISDPQEACLRYGYNWNATDHRCEICEKMGGSWVTTPHPLCDLTGV